jgi:hypothetical protein
MHGPAILQEFRAMSSGELPIWGAALVAVGCRARKNGESDPVEWQITEDYARYAATQKVVVEPFGVRLSPGDVLEVRWDSNESGYGLTILRARKRTRKRGPARR